MKRKTPAEQQSHDLRERLIAYYNFRKQRDGGKVQEVIASEIPLAYSTLNRYLTRAVDIKGLGAIAVNLYLEKQEQQ